MVVVATCRWQHHRQSFVPLPPRLPVRSVFTGSRSNHHYLYLPLLPVALVCMLHCHSSPCSHLVLFDVASISVRRTAASFSTVSASFGATPTAKAPSSSTNSGAISTAYEFAARRHVRVTSHRSGHNTPPLLPPSVPVCMTTSHEEIVDLAHAKRGQAEGRAEEDSPGRGSRAARVHLREGTRSQQLV